MAKKSSDNELLHMLKQVHVEKPFDTIVSTLSYGQQRLIELARALLFPHKLLLLDEPTAGVNPAVRQKLKEIIRKAKKSRKNNFAH